MIEKPLDGFGASPRYQQPVGAVGLALPVFNGAGRGLEGQLHCDLGLGLLDLLAYPMTKSGVG